MPNLKQIEALRNKYNVTSVSRSNINLRHIKALNESFNKSSYEIKSFFSSQGLDKHIIEYFEEQKSSNVILILISLDTRFVFFRLTPAAYLSMSLT